MAYPLLAVQPPFNPSFKPSTLAGSYFSSVDMSAPVLHSSVKVIPKLKRSILSSHLGLVYRVLET